MDNVSFFIYFFGENSVTAVEETVIHTKKVI